MNSIYKTIYIAIEKQAEKKTKGRRRQAIFRTKKSVPAYC
jgi:hypothetical protein